MQSGQPRDGARGRERVLWDSVGVTSGPPEQCGCTPAGCRRGATPDASTVIAAVTEAVCPLTCASRLVSGGPAGLRSTACAPVTFGSLWHLLPSPAAVVASF